ncbi:hypothetical protein HY641_04315 [Candidatus Woesearchaeota archaeon]|nr:hypothetical protein [Candidatus Woesearchaeota archaeon]
MRPLWIFTLAILFTIVLTASVESIGEATTTLGIGATPQLLRGKVTLMPSL